MILILVVVSASAQDPQFSQYYQAPLYLNPGFTGITPQQRLVVNNRIQWPNLPQAFNTFMASYDIWVDELRSGFGILRVADLGERCAIRDKGFFVEAESAVSGLHDNELIVIVVDAEAPRESRAHPGQGIAIAAKHAHAEGMEGAQKRGGFQLQVCKQRIHAVAHFPGGLVGESHCQDGRGRHVPGGNNVGDAVSNHARLSTAGAGKDQ